MRLIEVAMAEAIREMRPWRQSNTEVRVFLGDSTFGYPVIYVYLFDNCIAELWADRYIFRDCGWSTVTTRSRLNAVFWAVRLDWLIYQKNWQQYIWRRELGDSVEFNGEIEIQIATQTAEDWCLENGYTDPFFQEGRWWAFPINGVIPVPIAYYGSSRRA